MPQKEKINEILGKSEALEKKYDWLNAIDHYEEALRGVGIEGFLERGRVQERIGLCFHRAAMQAESQEEFKERIQRALEAYEKAHGLYEKLADEQIAARTFRCKAVAKYLGFWLASDPSEKRKLLDDCLELKHKALTAFWDSGNMLEYTEAYNELSQAFYHRVFLEWDRHILEEIVEVEMRWGEKAVAVLPELSDSYEIARSHLSIAVCKYIFMDLIISDPVKHRQQRSIILEHLGKAVEYSKSVGDVYLVGQSHLWLGNPQLGAEESERHVLEALECGERTRDNFLKTEGLDYLAYMTYWKALATEDPDQRMKLAEEAMEFYDKAQRYSSIMSYRNPRGGTIAPPGGHVEHYFWLSEWGIDLDEKIGFLEESLEAGLEALRVAEDSDIPLVIRFILHMLSKTFEARARLELDLDEKRSLLEKALEHRIRSIEIMERLLPFDNWNLGVTQNYLAEIKAELSYLDPDLNSRRRLLEEAVSNKEKCLELISKAMLYLEKVNPQLYVALYRYQDTYGTLLNRLYELTNNSDHLGKAIEISEKAIESAGKLNLISFVAESYWKCAKAQDILGRHLEAAENFERASESYMKATEKIPQLKDLYQDHSFYMQAWSEIEKGKHHHAENRHVQAKEHYENAADLHEITEEWSYLSPNYLAWARLEEAEDLSRRDRTQEARALFQQAANLFAEARKSIDAKLERLEVRDEMEMAVEMLNASDTRQGYCLGRIALEEAKILDREGSHTASSQKYGAAADILQKIVDAESGQSRKELQPIVYLCKAWQKMMMAEAKTSSTLYGEAAELFIKAKEHTLDQRSSQLALANCSFCKALEAGTESEITWDMTTYETAKKHMGAAVNQYRKAGFNSASEYARATDRLFDAYMYIHKAETEIDLRKKAQYYQLTEKLLQASTGAYIKARHPEKGEEVRRLLKSVEEEGILTASLTEILQVPTTASTTASFLTLTPTSEQSVGLERFEHSNIRANLILNENEIAVDEQFGLDIDIINAGKKPALLIKIEKIIPESFILVGKPKAFVIGDNFLSLRGMRIEPIKAETVRLLLRPSETGSFLLKPKIMYLDDESQYKSYEPEPITLNVKVNIVEVRFEPNRISTGYRDLDNVLYGGLPEGYAVILTSPSCDERELLLRRFLENSARECVTFHLSGDLSRVLDLAEDYPSTFHAFVCNLQVDLIAPDWDNIYKIKGVGDLSAINISLTEAIRDLGEEEKGRRRIICIDILSDVLLRRQALTTREWLSNIVPRLKASGFTILACLNPYMHSTEDAQVVTDIFDGHVDLYQRETQGITQRFLTVKKMYQHQYMEKELLLDKNKLLTP